MIMIYDYDYDLIIKTFNFSILTAATFLRQYIFFYHYLKKLRESYLINELRFIDVINSIISLK